MAQHEIKYEVVSPSGEPKAKLQPSASRISDLNGKTICMVSNLRFRADEVFAALSDLLKKRFPSIKIVPWNEMPGASIVDIDKACKDLKETYQKRGCDAVITSTGG